MVGVAQLWRQKFVLISLLIMIMVRQSKPQWRQYFSANILFPSHTWKCSVLSNQTLRGRLQFYGNASIKIQLYVRQLNKSQYFYGNQTQGEGLVINFQYKPQNFSSCRIRLLIENPIDSGSYFFNLTKTTPTQNITFYLIRRQYHKNYPLKGAYILPTLYAWPLKVKVTLDSQKPQQRSIRLLSDQLEGQYNLQLNKTICLPQLSLFQWVYIVFNEPDFQLSQNSLLRIEQLQVFIESDQDACCGAEKKWNQEILTCIPEIQQTKYLSERNQNTKNKLSKRQNQRLMKLAANDKKRMNQGYQSIGRQQFFLPSHIYQVSLQRGQKLTGYVDWNGELDIDIFIIRSGESLYDQDIQTQQFTKSTWQDFSFMANSTGMYFIKIIARKLLPKTIQYTLYYQTTISNLRRQLVGAFYKDSHNYSAFPIKIGLTDFKILCDIWSQLRDYTPLIQISKGDQQPFQINSSEQITIKKKAAENLIILVSVPQNQSSPLSNLFLTRITGQFYIRPLKSSDELINSNIIVDSQPQQEENQVWKIKMIILCVALGFFILLTAAFIFYYVRNNNRRQISKPYVNDQVQSRETQHKQHVFTQRQLNVIIPSNPQQS